MAFQKILAAVDDTELGQSVFEQAMSLAQSHQAKLLLFHSLTEDLVPKFLLLPGEMGLSPQLVTQAYYSQQMQLEMQAQHIQALFAELCDRARQQGVSVQISTQPHEPGRGICHVAKFWNADLIVMGRRGRRGFTELLQGSVSNYVLHHACCPVLVVQSDGDSMMLEERSQSLAAL
ncbi:MAG: universal stress protein [Cyanobacteria bacterium J06638_20]